MGPDQVDAAEVGRDALALAGAAGRHGFAIGFLEAEVLAGSAVDGADSHGA